MSAVVTDQFRILNASNFVDSVLDTNNSYYVFLGLSNAKDPSVGFGRTSTWDTQNVGNGPNPVDNLQYMTHYRDTSLFGKRITGDNVRRVIRKVQWTSNTQYDMYRHDYSSTNESPNSKSARLYDSNYYVINKDFRVYICIDNGSSGSLVKGSRSKIEPTSTDLLPSKPSGDDYSWKYLFTVSPSDIVKFDSTEYIVLPNNWSTSTDPEISRVRDGATTSGQIKKVYIESAGTSGYSDGTYNILGDGTGATVQITTNAGKITKADVVDGGSDYTWGVVDLGVGNGAKLIPIIPPSKGHGYDIYTELGADRVLVYSRFDDSTKDFPIDTKFAQVGLIKNPQSQSSSVTYTGSTYSSLYAIKLTDSYSGTPVIGEKITQEQVGVGIAKGYVASYDSSTKVLKYYRDRSLYFNNQKDQIDYTGVSIGSTVTNFNSTSTITFSSPSGQTATVSDGFSGSSFNGVDLGVTFTSGLASPEINKKTGDIIYIDNKPEVQRNIRQKEDIKIILEF